MKNLLKFEFRKLFQMKSLYIFMGVLVLFVLIQVGTYKMLDVLNDIIIEETASAYTETETYNSEVDITVELESMGINLENNGKYFLTAALYNSNITIALAVLIALIFCSEHSQGTIKNIIAKGYSRTKLFYAKFAAVTVASLLFVVVCWISGFFFGYAFFGEIGKGWNIDIFYSLGIQFLTILAYCAMFSMVALLIKKTAGVIALCIFAPMGIDVVVTLVNLFIDSDKFRLTDYWISSNLISLSNTTYEENVLARTLIVAVSFIAVFTAINTLVSRKSDV